MVDPAYDLAMYFESLGLGSSAKGVNSWWLITGQLMADPQKQVALLDNGGLPPSFSNTDALKRPTVQVRILGDAGQYMTARDQAEAIYNAVEGRCDVSINGHRYLSLEPLQEPIWLGYRKSDKRPEWSLNVLMMTE